MELQVIVEQMAMLFAMMLAGVWIWKLGWFDEAAYQKLSKVVVNLLNPILVLYGVMGKEASGSARLLLVNLGFVLGFYLLLIFAACLFLVLLHPSRESRDLYRLMTIFPNVGFMGIPVITSIFGTESMIYIVFYMLVYNLLLYTYGLILAQRAAGHGQKEAGGSSTSQWKRMVNPGVLSSVAAVILFLSRPEIPAPVVNFCDYMGNATIPLSMLLIGMSIAKVSPASMLSNRKIYWYTFLKMLALPIAAILLLKPFPVDKTLFGIFALELAMPVGSIVTLVAKEYGADETICTNGIVISTLASIATIPIVCIFL